MFALKKRVVLFLNLLVAVLMIAFTYIGITSVKKSSVLS